MTQRLFHPGRMGADGKLEFAFEYRPMRTLRRTAMSTLAVAAVLGMAGCSVMQTADGYTVGGAAAAGFIGDSLARTNRNGPTGNVVAVP